MQFTDKEAFDAYALHPAHKAVGAALRSVSQNILDFVVHVI
jgi:Stress responsive A/B Barrel Domain